MIAMYCQGEFINGFDLTHLEQLERISQLVAADTTGILQNIEYQVVEIGNQEQEQKAINDWLAYTEQWGEGFVFKPLQTITMFEGKVIQPAMKCRGQKYLRIIYGMDYLDHLDQFKAKRGTGKKRSLAAREFILGYEAIRLFSEGATVPEIHKYILGILALESEDVDVRL